MPNLHQSGLDHSRFPVHRTLSLFYFEFQWLKVKFNFISIGHCHFWFSKSQSNGLSERLMRPIQKLILRKVFFTWCHKVSLPLTPRDCDLHWIQAVLKKQNGWYVLGITAPDCKICLAFSSDHKFLQLPREKLKLKRRILEVPVLSNSPIALANQKICF